MNSQTSKSLTEGSLYRHLCTLALPLILGNILQQFYNTIDAFVIGRFAGTGKFAAIGIAGTVMNLFLFALVGVCTGFSSLPASFICFTVIGNCCFKKKTASLSRTDSRKPCILAPSQRCTSLAFTSEKCWYRALSTRAALT